MARPRTINSPKQFDKLANAYFRECEANNEPILLTGLIRAVGLSSRSALDEYERREGFLYSVKKAKLRCEEDYEKCLRSVSPSGAIFALKNFGWKDLQQQSVELSGGVDMSVQIKRILLEERENGAA
jgi:hypothetical protein